MNEEDSKHRATHCQSNRRPVPSERMLRCKDHDLTTGVSACDVHEAGLKWCDELFLASTRTMGSKQKA